MNELVGRQDTYRMIKHRDCRSEDVDSVSEIKQENGWSGRSKPRSLYIFIKQLYGHFIRINDVSERAHPANTLDSIG